MKAIIMAGGEGTRLRPLTCNLPKPMVPIMGKPAMEHIINLLKRHGITEIGVTLAYLPQAVTGYFGDGAAFGVTLRYFTEPQPLGTAGSVKNAEDFLAGDDFLVISGDSLTDARPRRRHSLSPRKKGRRHPAFKKRGHSFGLRRGYHRRRRQN